MDVSNSELQEINRLKHQLEKSQAELASKQLETAANQKIQTALFQIAAAASTALDLPAFYAELHRIIGELMYAENFFIALYDAQTNIIRWPYYVDTVDVLPPPPTRLEDHLGATGWVLRHGQTLAEADDSVTLASQRGEYQNVGTESEGIAVPLTSAGRTMGVLLVQSYLSDHHYTPQDVQILTFVAQQIATSLERVRAIQETQRLLKETEQRASELAIINSVQIALATRLDFQGIIDSVGDKLTEIFPEDNVGIGFLDKASGMFKVPYLFENGRRLEKIEFPIGDRGLVSHMFKTKQPLVINTDYDRFAEEFGALDVSGEPDPKSWLGVPIMLNDEIIGVFSLQNWVRENAYPNSVVRLLQTLAGSLGVALENARLFAEVQQRNQEISQALEQQTATSEVLRLLSGLQPDLRSLLEVIAINAAKVCGADDTHIYRIEGETLKEWSHRGPIPGLEAGESLPLDRGSVTGRAIVDRQIIHIHDAATEMDETDYPISAALQRRWGYRTVLSTPLLRDGEPIGAISIRRQEVKPFTEKQLALLKIFADQAVIAIENVRLFEESQRLLKEAQQHAAELAIINRVQEGLASKLDFQGIIDLVGDKICEIFDVHAINITRYDADKDQFSSLYTMERGHRLTFEPMTPGPIYRRILNTRESLLFKTNAEYETIRAINVPGTEASHSGIYVPLLQGRQLIGVIALENLDRENAFDESDLRLLTTLAASMAVALENASLFDETQSLLKETEQRAAELSTVNTVSQALAAEIELDTLIQLAGEQIRHIFEADIAYIALHDRAANLIHFPYQVGEEFTTLQYGEGLTSKVLESGQPLLINEDVEGRRLALGASSVGRQRAILPWSPDTDWHAGHRCDQCTKHPSGRSLHRGGPAPAQHHLCQCRRGYSARPAVR